MRFSTLALAGGLLAGFAALASAQTADDIAFCAAFDRCKSCALSNRCVWCRGAQDSPQGLTGSCIPGNSQGPANFTACVNTASPGTCHFVAEALQCQEAVCLGGNNPVDCLSNGPNCGWCPSYSLPAFKDPTSEPDFSSYFSGGWVPVFTYPQPIPVRRGQGYCSLLSDSGSDFDMQVAEAVTRRYRQETLYDDPYGGDINKFFDAFKCQSPVMVNKAPANTQQAIDTARTMADGFCAKFDKASCSVQSACAWCGSACVSFYRGKNGVVRSTNQAACPLDMIKNLTVSTLVTYQYSSDMYPTPLSYVSKANLNTIAPEFCAGLTSKGMYTCGSSLGCRWCHTANNNAGACMPAQDAVDSNRCPNLPSTIVGASSSCGEANARSCNLLCPAIGTDIATCLKFPACGVCVPNPSTTPWNTYANAFQSAVTSYNYGLAGSIPGYTYCVTKNTTNPTMAIESSNIASTYYTSNFGIGCGGYVASGKAPRTWSKGNLVTASSTDQALAVAAKEDPCNRFTTCSECMLLGASMNCGLCKSATGQTTCMTGLSNSPSTAPPGRCDAPNTWFSASFTEASSKYISKKVSLTDICGASTCSDMNNVQGGCLLSQLSRESCAFCTVNNRVVPIDKTTWSPFSSAAPSQADCAWGSDTSKYLWNAYTSDTTMYSANAAKCEASTVPALLKCGGITDPTACVAQVWCGWCVTSKKCLPTFPYSSTAYPVVPYGSNTPESCPGSMMNRENFIGGGPNAKVKPLTCEMLSNYDSSSTAFGTSCATCLTATTSNGPCGWHRTLGSCAPASANGIDYSRLTPDEEGDDYGWQPWVFSTIPVDRSYKRAMLFGSDAVSRCANNEDLCGLYAGDPVGCEVESATSYSGPACYYCISDKSCKSSKNGMSCPLGSNDVLQGRYWLSAGYCESLTKYNSTMCVSQRGCGALRLDGGGFKCVQVNVTSTTMGGSPVDPASAPGFADKLNLFSAPGSLRDIPRLLSTIKPDGSSNTQVLSLVPGTNQGSLAPNCSICLKTFGESTGYGWCRKGAAANRCIPGNSTFGPFDKSQCEPGYFLSSGSRNTCTATNPVTFTSYNRADEAPKWCRYGLGGYSYIRNETFGVGHCATGTPNSGIAGLMPGNAAGPAPGFTCIGGPWITNASSCDALGTATIGLAYVPIAGLSFDRPGVTTWDFTPCDRLCLSKGISVSRRVVGYTSSWYPIYNTTLTPLVRSTGMAGCECLSSTVKEEGTAYSQSSVIWSAGKQNALFINNPSTPLSTMPSPFNVSFQIMQLTPGLLPMWTPKGMAAYVLYVNTFPVAAYTATGCSGPLASKFCTGSVTTMPLASKPIAAGSHPCLTACMALPQTVLVHNSQYATLVPGRPTPDAATGDLASCRCRPITLPFGGDCSSAVSKFFGGVVNFPYGNFSIVASNSSDGDISKAVIRIRNADTKADGGYQTVKVGACFGQTGSGACTTYAGPLPSFLSPDAIAEGRKPDPATPITEDPLIAKQQYYNAMVRRNLLSRSTDDCTYSCFASGFNIAVNGGTVTMNPAVSMPSLDCGCPVLSGSANGPRMSGSFKSGLLSSGRRLQTLGSGTSYSFSASVTGQDEIIVELTSGGQSLGSVTMDVAGCSNANGYFCGRAPNEVTAAATPSEASSGLSAGAIAAIVIGSLIGVAVLGGGGYLLYNRMGKKGGAGGNSSGGKPSSLRTGSVKGGKTVPEVATPNPISMSNPMASNRGMFSAPPSQAV